MSNIIKIKKGKDLNLVGAASNNLKGSVEAITYAVKPTDFKGLIPKLDVKVGDEVKAGQSLFHSKGNSAIKFNSPVSGEVVEIVRGERRAILEVKVLADKEISYEQFPTLDSSSDREAVVSGLMNAGLWPFIKQRPFNVLADPEEKPKAIYISGFNSAPLGAEVDMLIGDEVSTFQSGINVISKLTEGKVHLSLRAGAEGKLAAIQNVEKHSFSGPHPAGLVGIQIHHIEPINKGDVLWTLHPQAVLEIGRLAETGKYDARRIVAVAGSEVKEPCYYSMIAGACVENLTSDLASDNVRVISGDVLTGTKIEKNGYLGGSDNLITVIPEGDEYEFLGWLIPNYRKPTISSSFPLSKMSKKPFKVNTNLHGEDRAFVVTGEYEQVLPMDVMPVQLLKSILAQDLEKMEQLGIYEVVEEDFALCEFVCTSKIEVQQILRDGLEIMAEES